MQSETELLLKYSEEQWEQARQCENQRSTMASLLLLVYTAGIAVISAFNFGMRTIPIVVLLILTALFGAIFSIKLFERWKYHELIAIKWRDRVNMLNPEAKLQTLYRKAQNQHLKKYPRLSKLALYNLWMYFYIFLAVFAVIILVFILTS